MFEKYDIRKMPGHWFLARMGKRVLRPGGIGLTRWMIDELNLNAADQVVEFAPGLGSTTRLILDRSPESFVGIDRSDEVVGEINKLVHTFSNEFSCKKGSVESTGLPGQCATTVIGEAVLTMQSDKQKQAIMGEAHRLLNLGGKYAIHEIGLIPDTLPDEEKDKIKRELSAEIHVNARPLTESEWKRMLESAGFQVKNIQFRPMHLLKLGRLFDDEGLRRVLKIGYNILTSKGALKRVMGMRAVFNKYQSHMKAISIISFKP